MKSIPGYDGYFADEGGHILSNRTGALKTMSPRLHKGYLHINVRQGIGRRCAKQVPVHRLVLLAFKGISGGSQCRHLNGNALDNQPSNLMWGTASENMHDELIHGTAACLRTGEAHPCNKLSAADVKAIKEQLAQGKRQCDIAIPFGISQRHVSSIKHGETTLSRGMAG